ncbi:P-loop containing dynein motor region D4-domain-containing protein [Lanmaoa asiatica]|nr:P-loop containing dynein motor region D4-domain-containing protein [Lanmaoa asiatica]
MDREVLCEYTKACLRMFYEKELDVLLVLFDDMLNHILRIDHVFHEIQGHLLLIGTTLSHFVAWLNGLSIFQIEVLKKYTRDDFDDDLHTVLQHAGCKGEKISFIMDESNVLDSGFLECMNMLLANAEVPGLFKGDKHTALFTQQVAKNLHVVFTMNPPENDLMSYAAMSPALFNQCILDWFGDWPDQALYQYQSLCQALCNELEKQQCHLHIGLDKLKNIVTQIEKLYKSLATKCSQLEAKNSEANKKLKHMVALVEQDKHIAKHHAIIMANLANTEPAMLEAQVAGSNIKQQHLQEVRMMANPSEAVKLAMEIINFDTNNQIMKPLYELMKEDFLNWPLFNFETVRHMSKACGLLVKWMQSLKTQAETTKKQASQTITIIAELEVKITKYKEGYMLLISETQRSLYMVAFFDQHYQEAMWQDWSNQLLEANIKFKLELSLMEYLSTMNDYLSWQSKSLLANNLTTENATMLKQFNHYLLIIDLAGQATTFLLNKYKEHKITVTSFLDKVFLKVLESTLQFRTSTLIQDVKCLDPILNAILNKKICRTGGCVPIHIGNQDINLLPAFTMFLSIWDPLVKFFPDICTRVPSIHQLHDDT